MSPELHNILIQIFEVCIIPLIGVLTGFLIKLINKKSQELSATTDDILLQKYIALATETVTKCVMATNQTYVDSLKKSGTFDLEAQKEAFNKTLDAVLAILSQDALTYLKGAVGDVEVFLTQQIEAAVADNK